MAENKDSNVLSTSSRPNIRQGLDAMAENEASNDSSSPKPNLRQGLEDFSGYTTLHGFHFVCGANRTIGRRLIWLMLILTGLCFLSKQLIESYKKLAAYEYVISTQMNPSSKLTFPAVTICNINMMKKWKILGTDAQVFLDELNVIKRAAYRKEFVNKTLNSSFNIEKAVQQFGHTAEDMIQICTWNGIGCSHRNVTTSFSHTYGLCHTFNSGHDGHPLLSSTSNKRSRGLNLLLDITQHEYYGITSYFNTGIRMVVHDQNEKPMVEVNGIDVEPGHITTVKIQQTEFNSLPPPFKSACGSRKLKTSNVYTRSTCLMECNTRKVIKQCGCRLLGMPDLPEFNGTKYCNPEEMIECGLFANITQRFNDFNIPLAKYFTFDSSNSVDNPHKECTCPKPCKQIEYKTTQLNTVESMRSVSFWDDYKQTLQSIDPWPEQRVYREKVKFRENKVILIVHYDDLYTVNTTERIAYDITDFGSDVGGNLGLFLGCSILTVFEILDFILSYCFGRQKAKKRVE